VRFSEIIEAVTSQGFKFGFEFECLVPKKEDPEKLVSSLPVKFTVTSDSSIKPNIDDKATVKGVEFVSEPLILNPQNIISAKQSIINLLKAGCYTNESCGFHIHYSYEGMNYSELCWFLIVLSSNQQYSNSFSSFKDINFINLDYASDDFLDRIYDKLKSFQENPKFLFFILIDAKMRILRIHPQGTLEWRGPRNFMNSKNFSIISDFFLHLYKNADLIEKISRIKSINVEGKTITKTEIFSYLKQDPENKNRYTNKKDNDGIWSDKQDKKLLPRIFKLAPWLSKAKISGALIGIDESKGKIIWEEGIWLSGTWHDGIWRDGIWKSGSWNDGIWHNGDWLNGTRSNGNWLSGTWHDGTWENGTWENGTWHDGIWEAGIWEAGIWNNGTWRSGTWRSGTWVEGTWKSGTWQSGEVNVDNKNKYVSTKVNPNITLKSVNKSKK
jgi:hypothetical protein